MEGLYAFLAFLEGEPSIFSSICKYQKNRGEGLFNFAVEKSLVQKVGSNSLNEDLYGLTIEGKKLLTSPNFNEALKLL